MDGDAGSRTSSKRIEWALRPPGVMLARGRVPVRGVCSGLKLAGDMALWRPVKGLIGEDIKYSASPGVPRMSGEEAELWLYIAVCHGGDAITGRGEGHPDRVSWIRGVLSYHGRRSKCSQAS